MVETSLHRLRELALSLPRPGCTWEERPRFGPPAAPAVMAALERAAGFSLPAEVYAFLAQAGAVVAMSVHNGYWLGDAERLLRWSAQGTLPHSVEEELALPVATDGGGNAFLVSASGRIWRWDHETAKVSEVAATFGAFLARVVTDWEAYIADTAGWRYLV